MTSNKAVPVKEDKKGLVSILNGLIIDGIIIYLFVSFIDWMFAPFYRKTTRDDYRDRMEDKQDARDEYLEQIANDENDPMFQYQLRFLEEVNQYRRDPDNKVYATWYDSWKKGEVLDSSLRWVPVMYTEDDDMTPEFVEYMKIQYLLHKKAGPLARIKFMKTIRNYYPEFSASFKGMAEDLARYCSMVTNDYEEQNLRDEIKKFGLPDDYADYLVEQDVTPAGLRNAAVFFKECVSREISLEAAVTAYTSKGSIAEAEAIEKIMQQSDLPARAILAYIRKEASEKEILKLVEFTKTLDDPDDRFSDQYETYIDSELKKFRANKRAVKFI